MQPRHVAAAIAMVLGMGGFALPASAQATAEQVPVCPSPEKASQVAQGAAGALPEGCRTVRIRRMDSPAGPLCGIDLTKGEQGVVGAVLDVTEQWWTACANLRLTR